MCENGVASMTKGMALMEACASKKDENKVQKKVEITHRYQNISTDFSFQAKILKILDEKGDIPATGGRFSVMPESYVGVFKKWVGTIL